MWRITIGKSSYEGTKALYDGITFEKDKNAIKK